jgi:DNA-binding transcriptional MerR regulator
MRIGELSRRTGVSPELLRAWEQRYGLLRPARSAGGFRLYSADDEMRVRRTTALIAEGMSAAEAARVASSRPSREDPEASSLVEELTEELRHAMELFDSAAAHAAMDRVFGTFSIRFALTEVLVPYLRDLGDRWARGELTVAQEHFASHLLRGRALTMAGDWGTGGHSTALLACLPREAHDLGLIFFGILLARHGWRVTFLGADTPFDTLEVSVHSLRPNLVVLATLDEALFHDHADDIARLAASTPVALAAPVDDHSVVALGAQALSGPIDEAAEALSTGARFASPHP